MIDSSDSPHLVQSTTRRSTEACIIGGLASPTPAARPGPVTPGIAAWLRRGSSRMSRRRSVDSAIPGRPEASGPGPRRPVGPVDRDSPSLPTDTISCSPSLSDDPLSRLPPGVCQWPSRSQIHHTLVYYVYMYNKSVFCNNSIINHCIFRGKAKHVRRRYCRCGLAAWR